MGKNNTVKKVVKSLSELKDIIGVTDVQVKTPASKTAQPAEEFVCTDEKAEPTYFEKADTEIVSMVINERVKKVVEAAKPKVATMTAQETSTTEKETIMSNETNNVHDFILQKALETSEKVIAVVEGRRYSLTSNTRAEAAVEGRFFESTVAKTGIAADATKVKIAERYAKTKKAIIARVTRPSRIASILKSKAEPVPTPMNGVDEALNVM